MNYQIDKNSHTPAYMQLYRILRDDITEQIYAYGDKLPSKRIIAAETGVSVITVEHALNILCEEGYVEARERSGYYIIYRAVSRHGDPMLKHLSVQANEAADRGKHVAGQILRSNIAGNTESFISVDKDPAGSLAPSKDPAGSLAPSEDPVGSRTPSKDSTASTSRGDTKFPFTVLARTMRRVLSDLGEGILEKSPGCGLELLRQEICSYLARSRGIHTRAEQVVIGSGAEYLYGLIAQLFMGQEEFALEDPSYMKIRKVYESFGIRCDMLELDRNGIRSERLAQTKARILHVTPFHSFPSGITADISKKHEYLTWARQRNGYIIEDNYDSELTVSRKPEDPLFSMDGGENVIYLNTFTKTIAPSIRVGYLILPEKLLERFREKLGFYSCTVPVFEQSVLAELIRNGDYERHVNRVRRARRRSEI